jgi:periplasmic protein TonB
MKRNNEKVPEFDEIIFENRNKSYGAYNLRKNAKSVTSLSILGGIGISAILITALSFTPKDGPVIIEQGDLSVHFTKSADPVVTPPPVVKPPEAMVRSIANLQPKVVTDSNEVITDIPITDVLIATTTNGDVNDSVKYSDPVTVEIPAETKPFVRVEEMPEYPGGLPALMKFIGDNLIYPPEAQANNIQGRVFLQFVVNADGSTDRIEVTKGVDPLLDNEAIRVLKILPKFRPGKQGGVPVPVWFALPVTFKITNN